MLNFSHNLWKSRRPFEETAYYFPQKNKVVSQGFQRRAKITKHRYLFYYTIGVIIFTYACLEKKYIAMTLELCNALTMDEPIRAELDKLTELIINAIPVEQIYLFGSYAYGTPHKYSDLDLYVVLKDDIPMRDLDAGLQIALAIARKKSCPLTSWQRKKWILTDALRI